jgi:hypothetical protein
MSVFSDRRVVAFVVSLLTAAGCAPANNSPNAQAETGPGSSDPDPEPGPAPDDDAGAQTSDAETSDAVADGAAADAPPMTSPAPTLLDCKFGTPTANDRRCKRTDEPLGSGPRFQDPTPGTPFGYGFLEGDTLVVAMGNRLMGPGQPRQGTIMRVDLRTGDRAVVSGTYSDPATGAKTVGTGPEFGNVGDVQKGPDGAWYVYAITDTRRIMKVDPATGARTLVGTISEGICRFALGGGPGSSLTRMNVVAPDEFLVTFDQASPARGILRVKMSGGAGTCTVLTGTSASDKTFERGSGPPILSPLAGVSLYQGSIYAVDTTAGALLKIDPATGDRIKVSSTTDKLGSGAFPIRRGFLAIRGKTATQFGTGAGTSPPGTNSFHTTISLETGDRTGSPRMGDGPAITASENDPAWAHATWPFLILTNGDSIVLYDPATGNRNYLSYQ